LVWDSLGTSEKKDKTAVIILKATLDGIKHSKIINHDSLLFIENLESLKKTP
jgi:hypothetical protein